MPEPPARLRVLIVAPYLNGAGLGEGYSMFRWVEALSQKADVTVLALVGRSDIAAQLPHARVIQMRTPEAVLRLGRLNAMAKPWLPVFFRRARKWIRREMAQGKRWDIAHQILPQAMRYAAPFSGLDLPYVIGPLGGSLTTPAAFALEVADGGLSPRLRALDGWRLRHDHRLRRGYERAGMILGVAPYVGQTLADAGIAVRRFEPVLERAFEGTSRDIERTSGAGDAHLVHVGRAVRTKGLRDVIRAMAHFRDLPGVHLTSAGDGPDLARCKAEAEALGVADRVTFRGRIPREEVDRLYASADVFCFPSFREPMGGVFFEAMEFGLPVIAAARGGPDFILDDSCAIKMSISTPDALAEDVAAAVRRLAMDPVLRRRMGAAAAARIRSFGTWQARADDLIALYRAVLRDRWA